MQTLSDYLTNLIQPNSVGGIEYDVVHEMCQAEGSPCVLVAVAHRLSEMNLDVNQAEAANELIQSFASSVLAFNVGEGSVWSDEVVEAVF